MMEALNGSIGKKHWISIVFNENTNYDFILLSKQGRTQLIIQLNMFLKISGGISRLLSL